MKDISHLKDRHVGERVYIVGMGPSLLNLTPEHFGPGPIIACYESIHLIERWNLPNDVYSLQKDNITWMPKRAPLLLHSWESYRQHDRYGDYEPVYVFDTQADFDNEFTNTSFTSVSIALLMGARQLTIFCFDMTTHGDSTRAIVLNGEFVKDDTPDKFLKDETGVIAQLMEKFNAECTYVTPERKICP